MPDDDKKPTPLFPFSQAPSRPATVPTVDGVFPVSPNGGGARRKRRPHIDLAMHDAKVKLDDQADLLEAAWGIIANANGGNWSQASPEWRAAAEAWRDRYFAAGKVPDMPLGETPVSRGEREAANFEDVQRHAGVLGTGESVAKFEAGTAAADRPADASLDDFMVRLSALPPSLAQKELPNWNGEDESFMEAATARWAELHPAPAIVETPAGEIVELVVETPAPDPIVEPVVEAAPVIDPEEVEEMKNLAIPGPPAGKAEGEAPKVEAAPDPIEEAPAPKVEEVREFEAPAAETTTSEAPKVEAPAPIAAGDVPPPPPPAPRNRAKTPKP